MNIVQIEPGKKYVLVLPEANAPVAERVLSLLKAFVGDDKRVVFAIYGQDVAIVPADQIVGYKVFDG